MEETTTDKSGNLFDLSILRRLMRFAKPYQGMFYLLIFLTLLLGFSGPIRPYLFQVMIDQQIAAGDYSGLSNMLYILLGLLVVQSGTQYAHTYISGWLGQNVIRDIRVQLYEHILSLRLKFFDRMQIGRLVTRNVSDVETLSNVFSEGLAAMAGDVVQIFFILALMFYSDWELTLVSLSTLPLLLISTYIFKEKIKYAFNDVRTAVSNLNSFVQEHITGMNIVQIFSSEAQEYEKFKEINEVHRKANIQSVLYYSIYYPVAEIIAAIGTGLLVWYGARGVLKEDVTFGTLVAFIMYISMFFRPVRAIADRFNTLQLGVVSTDRIFKLLDNREHIVNGGEHRPAKLKGDVQFKNVWFAYNDADYVLKDISFQVKKGETLALVGATGAGKSSIINLLNRFYEINRGEILLDGVNIREFDLTNLRSHIGLVLQDVFLFSGSIEENITLNNPDISRDRIWEAAELVGARKFIEALPGGLDYKVMERGATLSVGQRQLISFIRAMVYDPQIIILDEATSSVDTETEEMIQNAIEKLMFGRTSIVIAHRLSTIQTANQILVLDKGEIKERGTHEKLLTENGYYAQLHRMQYKEVV
ncbi:ATP-binding cassette, subfamily B [Catalinimonas alkaloidigena]|uniref:ATP-binding cassette, subfamily B n=1 Tax=Catalinimonas alkaloidigena TaxID=1075417 RepID=A0A1G9EPP8_9BACT|nr:ABC transporter ATP-binding protein [Catalinimonas alkaloidigena]SDK78197.1 ATP-binding cassette, subfamily B [Catalinimonas alkaloidigena]